MFLTKEQWKDLDREALGGWFQKGAQNMEVEYGRGQMTRSVLNIVPGWFLMLTVVKVSNFFPPQSVGRHYKIT